MQKWEYQQLSWHLENDDKKVYALNGHFQKDWKNQALHELLNKFGDEGWELVAFDVEEGEAILKRPKS